MKKVQVWLARKMQQERSLESGRWLIGLALVVAGILIAVDLRVHRVLGPDMARNLASELVGIALTVGIVDFLLDGVRQRHEDQGAGLRVAAHFYAELKHALSGWLRAGPRDGNRALTDALAGRNRDEPLPEALRVTLEEMASEASLVLDEWKGQPALGRVNPHVVMALQLLASLPDPAPGEPPAIPTLKGVLHHLARVLDPNGRTSASGHVPPH